VSYKAISQTGHPEQIVKGAIDELHSMAEEILDWMHGIENTNLENGEKYVQLSRAYNLLSAIKAPSLKYPHNEVILHFTVQTPNRTSRPPSRSARFTNAIEAISSVLRFYGALDDHKSNKVLIDKLTMLTQLSVNIPRMYG
jgi:hypothetical protein